MDTEDLMAALDVAIEAGMPADLKAKGWRYIDPPTKFSPEMWELFVSILGEGEYQILIQSEGFWKDGKPWVRGQFLMSPTALANLSKYRNPS